MQSKSKAAPDLVSSNEFQRSVLSIIEESSPCSEPKLFMSAVVRGLTRFGDESLADLRDRLVRCAQELKAHGLIEINEDAYVIVPTTSPDEHVVIDEGSEAEEALKQEATDSGHVGEGADTVKPQAENRVVSLTERLKERQISDDMEGAEPADADVTDLPPEPENAPEPAKDDASVTQVEDAEFADESVAASWMKSPRFMNLLGRARK